MPLVDPVVCADDHRPELVAHESPLPVPDARLAEEDRPGRRDLQHDGHHESDQSEHWQSQQAAGDVDCTLPDRHRIWAVDGWCDAGHIRPRSPGPGFCGRWAWLIANQGNRSPLSSGSRPAAVAQFPMGGEFAPEMQRAPWGLTLPEKESASVFTAHTQETNLRHSPTLMEGMVGQYPIALPAFAGGDRPIIRAGAHVFRAASQSSERHSIRPGAQEYHGRKRKAGRQPKSAAGTNCASAKEYTRPGPAVDHPISPRA